MGQYGQVGGHDRNCAAEKAKWRKRHPLPLDRQQGGYPSHSGDRQGVDGIGLAIRRAPSILLLATYLLAPRLSEGAAFRRGQHMFNGHFVLFQARWFSASAPSPRKPRSSSRNPPRFDSRRSAPRSTTRFRRCTSHGWSLPSRNWFGQYG